MNSNIHKKFIERLAEIYIHIYDTVGHEEANEWANRGRPRLGVIMTPDIEHAVSEQIKYLRAMAPKPQR
jgi:hypothetical protein